MNNSSNRRLDLRWWYLIYIIVVTGILFGLFSQWAYDDPFITYRYAYNLAHGVGFVYNPGEYVLSTSTPLFTLLLSVFSFFNVDLPRTAVFIGCLSLAVGGLFIWDLSQSWGQPLVGLAGIWLYPTFTLLLSTLGSETPLYLAFCLGALACYARRRYHFTALLAALAVLTRGDGALLAAVLAAHYLFWVRRPIPWRAVGLFLAILLPWVIFSWIYFGSPLPVTLMVKQHQGEMAISQRFAAGFVTTVRNYVSFWQYWVETALAILGAVYLVGRKRIWGLILGWTILYFVAYSALGVSRYFWYYAPLVPGFIVLVGLGINLLVAAGEKAVLKISVATHISDLVSDPIRNRNILAALLVVPLVLAQGQNVYQLRSFSDRRVAVYTTIGEWLQKNSLAQSVVGTLETGIIGYYAQRPMVDFAGLIQPAVAAQLGPASTYEDSGLWVVKHYHLDYLVLMDGLFPSLERGFVAEHCQPAKRFTSAEYGYSADLVVYSCN